MMNYLTGKLTEGITESNQGKACGECNQEKYFWENE